MTLRPAHQEVALRRQWSLILGLMATLAGGCSGPSGMSDGSSTIDTADVTSGTASRWPNSGVFAEWYKGSIPTLPYIAGGQVVLDWSRLDTPTGYNWKPLDDALSAMTVPTTLQINGSSKPSYVFNQVPYAEMAPCSSWPADQEVADIDPRTGCLRVAMYWHPVFQTIYENFLAALGQHLHGSTVGAKVVALRQNWNAIGTEHLQVPSAFQAASAWTVPAGVSAGPSWSSSAQLSYEEAILNAHVNAFLVAGVSKPPVFVRTNLESAILSVASSGGPTYQSLFQNGTLGWFFTSSEMEPRGGGGGGYDVFLTYVASGKTRGLAEPWANAWGIHSGIDDHHWASPPQFNYWRLLSDLQLGISYVDCYGDDLAVAQQGVYTGQPVPAYQTEFDAAFRFASKYAGYAGRPGASPGAFIAFRPADPAISNYSVTDYAEFFSLLNPQATTGLDARSGSGAEIAPPYGVSGNTYHSIGPTTQRFGAWARRLAAGSAADLKLDPTFETHENAQPTKILNVTYLDDVAGHAFSVVAAGQTFNVTLKGTGKWETASFSTRSNFSRNASGADVVVTARTGAITLHMVEVTY